MSLFSVSLPVSVFEPAAYMVHTLITQHLLAARHWPTLCWEWVLPSIIVGGNWDSERQGHVSLYLSLPLLSVCFPGGGQRKTDTRDTFF